MHSKNSTKSPPVSTSSEPTTSPTSKLIPSKLGTIAVVTVVVLAALVMFLAPRSNVGMFRNSTISGLAVLKQMAQQSVAYETAIANHKPTLIEFYANWCTTCQSMAPSMHKLRDRYGDGVNFVMLNIDDPQVAATIREYNVSGVPQLTFLSKSNEVIANLYGEVPKLILNEALEKLAL